MPHKIVGEQKKGVILASLLQRQSQKQGTLYCIALK